ncbi:unnamed protein product [Sphenostylis stenocarpa]|uniref:Uncharacterized protein n=1 Tax=Sphenostylis stenocarpa TaxID=92480 RepID=A0AA86S7Q6_9FABA|nr:unnamed protein product [Sphenostylis stenocarpa]
MATSLCTPTYSLKLNSYTSHSHKLNAKSSVHYRRRFDTATRICCASNNFNDDNNIKQQRPQSEAIQVYTQIERANVTFDFKHVKSLLDSRVYDGWWGSRDWIEVEGAWILKPKSSRPNFVVHFIGGIFVGAAPQLTYRWFLERLSDKYAVQRSGNVLMAFNNKEASSAVPLFSPVLVPMAQTIGPLLSDIFSSPTLRVGVSIAIYLTPKWEVVPAEMTLKQLENVSPPIMKQVLPLVEQLPPLYMDLVKGREEFSPKPEETRRLIKSYYGVSRNLLIKFKDDLIDETSTLAQVLSSESAISSVLDMSIRKLAGDHGLPLQQALPDVPPAMADAVNRGSELLSNLTVGTPWETVAKEVGNSLGMDSRVLRADVSKDMDMLVDVIASWIASNAGPKLLRP